MGGNDETSCIWRGLFGGDSYSPEEGDVHSVDVARHLGVTKASVSYAVSALCEGGFLIKGDNNQLSLTATGRKIAEKIYERYTFFTERLIAAGVDPEIAEADACRIEHVISEESFSCIQKEYRLRQENES